MKLAYFLLEILFFGLSSAGAGVLKHKRFFVHDNLNLEDPKNGTVVIIASSPSYPGFLAFGNLLVFDDKVTAGPDYNSEALGRSQGYYMSDALPDPTNPFNLSFLTSFTVNLRDGRISMHGQDYISDHARDFAIMGGSGEYSFTTGIARFTTYGATGTFSTVQVDIYYTKLFEADKLIKKMEELQVDTLPIESPESSKLLLT